MWLYKCSRRDSNSYHQNRNLTFYPLNYGNLILLQIYYFRCYSRGPNQNNLNKTLSALKTQHSNLLPKH